MQKLILFIILILSVILSSCGSKNNLNQNKIDDESFKLFDKRITDQLNNRFHTKFEDKVQIKKDNNCCSFCYNYGNNISCEIIVSYLFSDYFPLFEQGLLHPALLISGTTLNIGLFKESILVDGTKRKYKFWCWQDGHANPCEYTIETENANSTKDTTTKDFLTGSSITSISNCSLIM